MPKRHGITNNPSRRRMELEREYSGFKNFKIEKKFPNQEKAQEWENRKPNANPGGPKADGPFYGYSHSYKQKK